MKAIIRIAGHKKIELHFCGINVYSNLIESNLIEVVLGIRYWVLVKNIIFRFLYLYQGSNIRLRRETP